MPASANDNSQPPQPPLRPCPICGKLADPQYRPFCSKRCADIDLARWLGGRYSIPSRPDDEDEEDDRPPPPPRGQE